MGLAPFPGGCRSAEKIPNPRYLKSMAMASCSSPMANRVMRVRWQGVRGAYVSRTAEASRPWSAVCRRSSTAARRRGEKMTPGGGTRHSASCITAQYAAWQSVWKRRANDAT
jgi:hypothetical protein